MFLPIYALLVFILIQTAVLLLVGRHALAMVKWKAIHETVLRELQSEIDQLKSHSGTLELKDLDLTKEENAFFKTLSATETKLILSLLENRSNKEIAQEMGYSIGYIYNMKTCVKKKYASAFKGDHLDHWIKFRVSA